MAFRAEEGNIKKLTPTPKETLMKKRRIQAVVLPLLFLTLVIGYFFAQAQAEAATSSAKMAKESVKGFIDFNERLGGYFIRGQEPGGEFFITNPNPAVLKKLKESGDSLNIEGHTIDKGAEYFFIEKINGKKYSGAKTGRKKGPTK
jgi:hypothetical protein